VLDWYADIGRLLVAGPELPADRAIARGCERVEALVAALEIPRLSSWGVRDDDVERIVGLARSSSSMRGNPVALSDQQLIATLRSAV
ncbi:MAG: iron-containing alcohol dehydrogenase, partial [Candidatus Riflebacteria bacterium]|nr:iron-containing alcohol dehydrogenase [Candidatus Riflebacteria bacterium]